MAGPVSEFLNDMEFENFFETLRGAGWMEYFFPLLLVYAIVFTILENVSIFQDTEQKSKKPIRVVIALAFSIIAIAFPVNDSGATIGSVISELFPGVGVFAFGILGLYIVTAMMGIDLMQFLDNEGQNKWIKYVLGGIGFIWVVFYFGEAMRWWNGVSWGNNWFVDLITDPFLWILVIAILLFYWISSEPDSTGRKPKEGSE